VRTPPVLVLVIREVERYPSGSPGGVCMKSRESITLLLLKPAWAAGPGEEERITADQSKHYVPFPLKAPPEGLSLCPVELRWQEML
jgi:hypothetical protein